MRPILRRVTALVLCAALLSTTALASYALGTRIYSYTLDICDDTTLTREVMWSASRSDLRTENYVTYAPSASVSPKVSYGSSVLTKQSVLSMAKDLEKGGDRVLSGINGDYYVMATGNPLGLVVTDGLLRSSASYLSAIGFDRNGSAIIGKPDLTMRADFKGCSLKITDINKIRDGNGYYLFTDDFGSTTKNTKAGVDVILTPVSTAEGQPVTGTSGTALTTANQLKIGSLVSCRVEQVIEATGATAIPEGKFVLSIIGTGVEWFLEMARSLQPGDTVDIEVFSPDSRWNDIDCAVGAMYRLLDNGQVVNGLDASTAAPRTAVGIQGDGKVIFYTIDGRQSGHSVGATIKMVAQRLQELGCTDAVLLDGGGSTTMVSTYPDYTGSSMINSPSEGTPRSVTNAIFLVSNLDPTGKAGSLYVTPTSLTLLAGASTLCTATAMDTGWYPMESLPGEVTWSASDGTVSDSGLFTAPAKTGTYTVTAASGGVSGSTRIQVYDTPDTISVTNKATGKGVSSLTLTPGQTIDLNAAASYRTIKLTGGDTCFTWTADPAVGTITADGKFTAGKTSGTGKITVAAGNYAKTIAVTVDAPAQYTLLSDFEGVDLFFQSREAKLSVEAKSSYIKYGTQSVRADYTLKEQQAQLTAAFPLEDTHQVLSLWVYGDQSGNSLSATFEGPDGKTLTQALTTLNFSGWKRVTASVPIGATIFTGLTLTGSRTSGTLWLDQLVLSNQSGWDSTAPTVKVTASGTKITARLTDNTKNNLTQDRVTLTVDGRPAAFTFDAAAGTLTASLSGLTAGPHQVTVTAADRCGNLGRGSVTVSAAAAQTAFADMGSHWARDYTARLNDRGIITGIQAGGKTWFYPDRSITRGDFALMTARWLGLDLNDYASVSLPYADAAAIPSWDRNAVKALYALEIMQGSTAADGKVYANAKASITRAEAMTILGRLLAQGYPTASLKSFSDSAKVPTWAKDHVSTLVGLGVLSGSGGTLRPTDTVTRAEVAKLLFTLW